MPDLKDEPKLLQTLRGKDYFGQYGEIEKIVVSKAKPGQTNQGVGVYVTFARREDAAVCIAAIDGTKNEDRLLRYALMVAYRSDTCSQYYRAQYGTTKYCSAYLRGEECNNKNCSFLHETGEDGQDSNLQNEQIAGKVVLKPIGSTSIPTRPPPVAQPSAVSQPMARQPSSDTADSRKSSSVDPSALPSSASWAQANPAAPTTISRRTSQTTRSSPQITMAVPAVKQPEEVKPKEVKSAKFQAATNSQVSTQLSSPITVTKDTVSKAMSKSTSPKSPLDGLMAAICSGSLTFTFNEAAFTPDEMAAVKRHPNLIDPYGGAKMRLQKDKEAAERAKLEAELAEKLAAQEQAQSEQLPIDTNADDDNVPAGSLALGGEPEEDIRTTSARGTIQRPTQPPASASFINDQFANMNGTGRSLTPQQRQQLALLSGLQQAPGLTQPSQSMIGSENFDFERRGAQFSSQSHYDSMPGHQRQGSRYFNNENTKSLRNQAASFYTSGVQGPPPGLKTAGTPPFSGGATFAHGQGFTSNVNAGFGAKESSADYARGRSGTGAGHDMSKRESTFSLQNPLLRSPLQAPGPASLNPLYGPHAGAYQDPGLVKQKRKGKKHRHANTSSSGGVVDHADPNILQSRMHPNGAGAGQGLFGGQNQGGYQQSNSMYGSGGYGRGW